jgi:hypothetical protein
MPANLQEIRPSYAYTIKASFARLNGRIRAMEMVIIGTYIDSVSCLIYSLLGIPVHMFCKSVDFI